MSFVDTPPAASPPAAPGMGAPPVVTTPTVGSLFEQLRGAGVAAPPPPTGTADQAIPSPTFTPPLVDLGTRGRALIQAKDELGAVRAIGRWPQDGQTPVREMAASRVFAGLKDRGASPGALAPIDHAHEQGMVADPDFNSLYGRLVNRPETVNAENQQKLNGMVGDIHDALQTVASAGADLKAAKVHLLPAGGAAVDTEVTKPAGYKAIIPAAQAMPPGAAKPLVGVEATNGGLALHSPPDGDGGASRLFYPSHPVTPGVWRMAPSAPMPVGDQGQLVRAIANPDAPGYEMHFPNIGRDGQVQIHPAQQPGPRMTVQVDGPQAMRKTAQALGNFSIGDSALHLIPGVAQEAGGNADLLHIALPDDLTGSKLNELVGVLKNAGSTRPVLYTHQPPEDGWSPVTEHHYVTPAGVTVVHRSQAPGDPTATNAYPAFMRPADATKLGTTQPDFNAAAPKGRIDPPTQRPDGTYLAHNDTLVKSPTPPEASIFNTKIDGRYARAFSVDTTPGTLPTVTLTADPVPSQTAVTGQVSANGLALSVPAAPGGIDVGALARAIAVLRRNEVPISNLTVTGPDGSSFNPNGTAPA